MTRWIAGGALLLALIVAGRCAVESYADGLVEAAMAEQREELLAERSQVVASTVEALLEQHTADTARLGVQYRGQLDDLESLARRREAARPGFDSALALVPDTTRVVIESMVEGLELEVAGCWAALATCDTAIAVRDSMIAARDSSLALYPPLIESYQVELADANDRADRWRPRPVRSTLRDLGCVAAGVGVGLALSGPDDLGPPLIVLGSGALACVGARLLPW